MSLEPVSPQELYAVLCDAASQDPALVQASSQRLKIMLDRQFGTYEGLSAIATTPDVPLPVRQQSIIQFKNAVTATSGSGWKGRK